MVINNALTFQDLLYHHQHQPAAKDMKKRENTMQESQNVKLSCGRKVLGVGLGSGLGLCCNDTWSQ